MTFEELERQAGVVWDEIPEAYRSGVDGLVVRDEARPHPTLPEIYTLGECLTEAYPSDFGGPDTTRSILVLYHGSFERLARLDPDFDWEYEVWETITHELRHHLESLAAEDALEDVDYAMDENFKRWEGEPFDPFFFRSGEPVAAGVFQAEQHVFIELPAPDPDDDAPITFRWGARTFAVPRPDELGDVTFIDLVEGIETGGARLCVVLVRKRGPLASIRGWFRRQPPDIVQVESEARPAPRLAE